MDQTDFADLQRCITGDASTVTEDCRCFDRNRDNRINTLDAETFIECATGSSVVESVTPACAPL